MTEYEDGPKVVKTLLADWFDFFGLRALWLKFLPGRDPTSLNRTPATGFLWMVGLYVGLFGFASIRYEFALDRLDRQQAGIYAQLGSESWKGAIARIPHAQDMTRPARPNITEVSSVFLSIWGPPERDLENVRALKVIISSFKHDLVGANLTGVNLSGAKLASGKLNGALLVKANLSNANLGGADLSSAELSGANLSGSILRGAILRGALLDSADLREKSAFETHGHAARPSGAKFRWANESGLTCEQLRSARNWELAYRDERLACGATIPEWRLVADNS